MASSFFDSIKGGRDSAQGWTPCGGWGQGVGINYLSIRRPDAIEVLPLASLHNSSPLEWEFEGDLTLPGEWRAMEGALPIPTRPWAAHGLMALQTAPGLALMQLADPLIGACNPVVVGPGQDVQQEGNERAFWHSSPLSTTQHQPGPLPVVGALHPGPGDVASGTSAGVAERVPVRPSKVGQHFQ